jgi:hypothetical protein
VSDDLAGLFAAPQAKPSQSIRYRQGTIISFNPVTLANTVDVGGTVLVNLPLLGVGEATLLVPGSVVGIVSIGSDAAGSDTWAILGRLVVPGTAQAGDAVSLLNARTKTAQVLDDEVTSSGSYTDLGAFGPTVDVMVGPSGRLSVTIGAIIGISCAGTSDGRGGFMSYQVSQGGTAIGPVDDANCTALQTSYSSAPVGYTVLYYVATSRQSVLSGLTPGLVYTLTAKYKCTGAAAEFMDRSISVTVL